MRIIPAEEEIIYHTKKGKYAGYRKRNIATKRIYQRPLNKVSIKRNLNRYDSSLLEKEIAEHIQSWLENYG